MHLDTIHPCPWCGLRFVHRAELVDHVQHDHQPEPGDDLPSPAPGAAGVVTVPVDPLHEPALAIEVAAVVARQANLGVEILAVPDLGSWQPIDLSPHVRAALAAGAPRARSDVVTAPGRAAAAIVTRAARPEIRLVCMATHGRTAFGVLTLGSVSAGVLRRSPVPVLLVGPRVRRTGDGFRRLVACVDGSASSERALATARDLARRLSAQLVLLRVVPGDRAAAEQLPELAYLRDLAEPIADQVPRLDVIRGEPAAAIARYAGDQGDTLVVVGSHGHSGLRDAVLGSVARDVTRQAECPVLIVPPGVAAP